MIAPHKYLNLDLSVLNTGGLILKIMKELNMMKYDELLDKIQLERGEAVKEVFIPALGLLFLLGKIEYHSSMDIIELITT